MDELYNRVIRVWLTVRMISMFRASSLVVDVCFWLVQRTRMTTLGIFQWLSVWCWGFRWCRGHFARCQQGIELVAQRWFYGYDHNRFLKCFQLGKQVGIWCARWGWDVYLFLYGFSFIMVKQQGYTLRMD